MYVYTYAHVYAYVHVYQPSSRHIKHRFDHIRKSRDYVYNKNDVWNAEIPSVALRSAYYSAGKENILYNSQFIFMHIFCIFI